MRSIRKILRVLATTTSNPTKFILRRDGARRRDSATPLSVGPPAEGAPPVPMEQSLSKRPRPPTEAEQVRATLVAPHGPWPRPHHPWQPCWPPPWGAAGCWQYPTNARLNQFHWACLMAEAPLALARAALLRQRGPRPGGPYGHYIHLTATYNIPSRDTPPYTSHHTHEAHIHEPLLGKTRTGRHLPSLSPARH